MTKVITVILQFEQDRAYTVARPEFVRHMTDMIRIMNTNPNLGRMRYAGLHLADTMGSIGRLDHTAHGAPTADLPRVFTRCNACTNDIVCMNRGGCINAMKAVDQAADKLAKLPGVRARREITDTFTDDNFEPVRGWKAPPQKLERERFAKITPNDRSAKQPTANKATTSKGKAGKRGAKAKPRKR